jgi:hypothetical protein
MPNMARRTTLGARELKTRFGGYLQQVRQGPTLAGRGPLIAESKPLHWRRVARVEHLK